MSSSLQGLLIFIGSLTHFRINLYQRFCMKVKKKIKTKQNKIKQNNNNNNRKE